MIHIALVLEGNIFSIDGPANLGFGGSWLTTAMRDVACKVDALCGFPNYRLKVGGCER